MRQCNITPIINKENSYTNVILHGRFQKNFAALDFGANTKAPAQLGVMPNACPCWGLSLLLPRLPKPAPNLIRWKEVLRLLRRWDHYLRNTCWCPRDSDLAPCEFASWTNDRAEFRTVSLRLWTLRLHREGSQTKHFALFQTSDGFHKGLRCAGLSPTLRKLGFVLRNFFKLKIVWSHIFPFRRNEFLTYA